jgi:pimeloyl-ACP methyl ester carboxylesterase
MDRVAEVQVGGHSVAYRERGEGPSLVLLHGWPLDGREWNRQLDGLSDEYRVVVWDAPGAGRSSDPPETSRLSDWADWLAEFIDALDLGRSHVAGLSWGGGLALELYQRHPAVVRTLILVSAYAGWAGSLPADVVEERVELMRRNSRLPPDRWAPGLIRTLLADGAPPELADELAAMISEFHPAATRTALRAFAEADLRNVLPRIDVPTLLLCGERDMRAPREVWGPLHSRIPNSKLVVIREIGHMVDMEAPERCTAEIRGFLRAAHGSERNA